MKKVVRLREEDIAFYIKLYPLSIHPEAYLKAKAIVCEKSLELLEDAFRGRRLPSPSCDGETVDRTIELARELGITATPTVILPDGGKITGFKEASELIGLIETAGQTAEKEAEAAARKQEYMEREYMEPQDMGPEGVERPAARSEQIMEGPAGTRPEGREAPGESSGETPAQAPMPEAPAGEEPPPEPPAAPWGTTIQ